MFLHQVCFYLGWGFRIRTDSFEGRIWVDLGRVPAVWAMTLFKWIPDSFEGRILVDAGGFLDHRIGIHQTRFVLTPLPPPT